MSFFKRLKNKIQKKVRREVQKQVEEEVEKEEKKEAWLKPEGKLAIDVYKAEEELAVLAPIAGLKAGDLEIYIKGDVVTIKGTRERPEQVAEKDYYTQECYWGPFSRQIILPEEVDPSRAQASMQEGILIIKIPRIEREKKRKIRVKEG